MLWLKPWLLAACLPLLSPLYIFSLIFSVVLSIKAKIHKNSLRKALGLSWTSSSLCSFCREEPKVNLCIQIKSTYSPVFQLKEDENMKHFDLSWWSLWIQSVHAGGRLGPPRESVWWVTLQPVICSKQAAQVEPCRLMFFSQRRLSQTNCLSACAEAQTAHRPAPWLLPPPPQWPLRPNICILMSLNHIFDHKKLVCRLQYPQPRRTKPCLPTSQCVMVSS